MAAVCLSSWILFCSRSWFALHQIHACMLLREITHHIQKLAWLSHASLK